MVPTWTVLTSPSPSDFEAEGRIAARGPGGGEIFGGGFLIFMRLGAEAGEPVADLFLGRSDADIFGEPDGGALSRADPAHLAALDDGVDAGEVGRTDGATRVRCLCTALGPCAAKWDRTADAEVAEAFKRQQGGGGWRRRPCHRFGRR